MLSGQLCDSGEHRVLLLIMGRYYRPHKHSAKIKTACQAKIEEDLYVSTDKFEEITCSLIKLAVASRMDWRVIAMKLPRCWTGTQIRDLIIQKVFG